MKTLVAKVAALLGCSPAHARLAVDAVFLAVSTVEAKRVAVRGFGTFEKTDGALRFRPAKRSKAATLGD